MSNRYKGAVISATPPTTTGGESGTASGAWTLEQQMQLQAAGLWPSQPPDPSLFIENLFSTYLYTGNSSTQTINNGIDLSAKGGLVWRQGRSAATGGMLIDTARGIGSYLISYSTDAAQTGSNWIDSFNSNGFTMNSSSFNGGATYASWTFRKQAKFFDVVTYTGNGTNGRTVAHSLGSVPGCMIVKRTDASNGWAVYHRSMNASPQDYMMRLNATDAAFTTSPSRWNNTLPTATEFTLSGNDEVNGSGATYVAYLFAHDAGGFGLTGTDNVISCGSYTGNGSATGPVVTLGYEPQWVMVKRATVSTGSWEMYDSMRGFTMEADAVLRADTSGAEFSLQRINPTSTGFQLADSDGDVNANGSTYIYIAIRRGPMKVPTSGTSVFAPVTYTSNFTNNRLITTGILTDGVFARYRDAATNIGVTVGNRLTGNNFLGTAVTDSEYTSANGFSTPTSGYGNGFSAMNGFGVGINTSALLNYDTGYLAVAYSMQRAPSFFDVVCYTGTEVSGQTFTHNLGVVPEMMIVKSRSDSTDWTVYHSALGASARIYLNATNAANTGTAAPWNSTTPTSSVFSLGNAGATNLSGGTFVNYLFATCAGVSKVGSYTGTGTTLQIDCGFTAGSRFVMIKRTDSTGDWYVWDSARGIIAGNDPYLLLNSTAAEVTNTDYVDTYNAGFEISSTAPAGINANGGTYIFLAIA